MKKKKTTIFISTIVIVLLIIASIPVIRINQQYPQAEMIRIEKGTKQEIKNGISFQIQETTWLNKDELKEKYSDVFPMSEQRDYKAVFVKAILKNETDKKQKYELHRLYLELDIHYYNGLDMELYTAIEGNPMAEMDLNPKQEVTVVLPYSISDLYFEKQEWNKLEQYSCYLVDERYPKKICWKV